MKLKQLIVTAAAVVVSSLTLTSWAANYTWTGAGDGTSWSDVANWDGGKVPSGSDTATFPSDRSCTILVPSEDFASGTGSFTVSGDYVFQPPTTVEPRSSTWTLGGKIVLNAGASLTFKNLKVVNSTGNSGLSGGDLYLDNSDVTFNATLTIDGFMVSLKDSVMTVVSGKNLNFKESDSTKPTTLLIDNSTLRVGGAFPGGTSYSGGTVLFQGRSPRLLVGSSYTSTDSKFVHLKFNIPADGYDYVPLTVKSGNAFPVNGFTTFEIDPGSAIFSSNFDGVVPLVASVNSIRNEWSGRSGCVKGATFLDLPTDFMNALTAAGGAFGYRYCTTVPASTDSVITDGVIPDSLTWSETRTASDHIDGVYIKGVSGGDEPEEPTASVMGAVTASIDQRKAAVSGTVATLGSGDTKVYVKVGEGDPELVATLNSKSKSHDWSWEKTLANFGDSISGTTYLVNGPSTNATMFTSEPVTFGPLVAEDKAVYTWSGEGAWGTAANWTADKDDHAELPPAEAQVVIASGVVTIDNTAVSADALTLASGAQILFKGAAPSLTLGSLAGSGTATFEIPQGGWTSAPLIGTGEAQLAGVALRVSRESPALLGSTEWTTSTLVNWAGGVGTVDLDAGEADGAGRIAAMVKNGNVVTVQTRALPDVKLAAIPTVEHATLVSVSVGGVPVSAQPDGTYLIPGGSDVTVEFKADEGYGLTKSKVTFNVGFGETASFPADQLPKASELGDLVINEVMASNETTLSTLDGVAGLDWVELYNPGDAALSLDGWKLTDDPDGKASKRKPIEGATEIPAGGYLVVFLDKDKTDWADGVPHAAIGLSASGESIALVNPSDIVVSRLDFGAQFKDVSIGPGEGPGGIVYFKEPTPGAANGAGQLGPSPKVTFSVPHGYKIEAFDLEMTCDDPNAKIYYTTDGTSPTTSSTKYTSPIHISQTTVIRARAIVSGSLQPIHEQDYSATYLFVEDIIHQSADTPTGFLPTYTANDSQQRIYYGMVTTKFLKDDGTHIIDKFSSKLFKGTAQERQINLEYDVTQRLYDGFTNDFRTVSLVIDPKALFDSETGIYNHATKQGDDWERQTMIEQIHPGDEADEFSIACGIRIRGAITRGNHYPKRAFHLSFRSDYGYSKLQHPLFGDEGAKEFDKIDLRNDQTAYPGGANKESMVHELFSRDCQRDLGTTHNRTRYLNLFINGIYWGLYQYEERVNDSYAESYNKGAAENYDIVRTYMDDVTNVRTTGLVSGTTNTWVKDFWLDTTLAQGYGTGYPANYNRVRGLNADGTRNPAYPVYLNVTNLIKYVLVSHYVADTDSPCNSQANVNNIIAFRNRVDGEGKEDGFLWNRHDAEQSLAFGTEVKFDNADSYSAITNTSNARRDNCLFGVFNGSTMLGFKSDNKTVSDTDLSHFNPHMLHYRLCDNAEYKMVFADQVYRHLLREGGAMTPTNNYLRYTARMHEIRNAMAGETARWAHNAAMQTSADYLTWIRTCAANLAFIEVRTPFLLELYRDKYHWYPSVDAPSATKGGAVLMDGDQLADGEKVTLAGTGGTVYYTLDGSDPRLEGGSLNAAATPYSTAFELPAGVSTIHARVRTAGGEWSALEEVTVKGAAPAETADPKDALRVAEIMSSSACEDGDADDYLVLTNLADSAVSLANVKLVAWNAKKKSEADPSLTLTFAAGTEIAAHGSLKLTAADFADGKLANSDVGLRLYDVSGAAPVLFQDCFVSGGWFDGACDGKGGSFIALEFGAEVKAVGQWRASNAEPPPEGDDLPSVDGGYRFILEGDYTGVKSITPTGAECRVILQGANLPDGLVLNGEAVFEFKPDEGTTNDVGSLYGPAATFKIEGDGAVRLAGADTLATVSNLHVKAGSLLVRSTGVAATKTPVVKVLGYAKETGGAIDIDLSVTTTNQIYGIFLASKDLKDAEDNNLGVVYAEISGGEFNATVGGTKSAALYVDKGSVDTTFKDTNTVVTVRLCGVEPRFVNVAGDLEIKNGSFTVTMPEDCTSVADARVFKSDKDIDLQGGAFNVNVPGPGAEVFCADEIGGEIDIDGGTFEIVADDDCFSAMDRITVDGGLIYAVSLNNDVFDSNGDMRLRGGTILAYATANGHEAFDVDPEATAEGANPHTLTVSNAVVFATGGKTADWPDNLVLGEGTQALVLENAAASDYAEKYLTLVAPATGTSYAAKLPRFPDTKCAIFATAPGYDGATPSTSSTAPAKGDQGFHDLYVWSAGAIEVSPGSPADVAAADADAAIAAVVLKVEVPTDEQGDAVVEESVYKGYFKLVAELVPGETGLYSVSAVLDESLVRPAIERTEAIDAPFTIDEETSAVTVAAKQGLYYSLLRGATVDAIETVVDSQLATGEAVTLTDKAKLPVAAFYRVAVSFSK